ncbi:hypothetical protein K439DRAFT_1628984 [Ramaria rubella]|nr:hypothetical protein K439DRAFT_1628984 [Ramaria rubella]
MSLKLLRLAFLITTCTASPPALHSSRILSGMRAPSHGYRKMFRSALMISHKRSIDKQSTGVSAIHHSVHHRARKGISFDAITAPQFDSTAMTDVDAMLNTSVERSNSTVVTSNNGVRSEPSPIFDVVGSSSSVHNASLKSARISVNFPLVSSAIGGILLIISTLLIIRCRRRARMGQTSPYSTAGRRWWFGSSEKEKLLFIRVPPPTMPLKGILIRNPSDYPPTPTDAYFDRMSVTSSQMSMIINKLPKSYNSGLGDGVLDELKEGGRNSPVKVATRVGPSPSDFLSNLLGLRHANSFNSDTSSASGESILPPVSPLPLPRLPPYSQCVAAPHAYVLPSLTSVHSPTPTFPPATVSPTMSLASGPRGHGLVLTGDQSAPTPSFAQWHYQRTMSRSRGVDRQFVLNDFKSPCVFRGSSPLQRL